MLKASLRTRHDFIKKKTKAVKAQTHIDLLKIEEGDKSHNVFIKDYNRLISKQCSEQHKQKETSL